MRTSAEALLLEVLIESETTSVSFCKLKVHDFKAMVSNPIIIMAHLNLEAPFGGSMLQSPAHLSLLKLQAISVHGMYVYVHDMLLLYDVWNL